MDKQKYRARASFEPTADGDKRTGLAMNQVVEITDAEAEAYGDVVVAIRPYVVKVGHFTQFDETGQASTFGPGATILLSDAEVQTLGEEKFTPVKKAPALTSPALAVEGASKP